MNIILCDKNCKYQKDGYCNINSFSSITGFNKNGCLYFTEKKLKNKETHS